MANVCSWCGAVVEELSESVEFVCTKCASDGKERLEGEVIDRREWKPWMPAGEYPELNKKDTRRL